MKLKLRHIVSLLAMASMFNCSTDVELENTELETNETNSLTSKTPTNYNAGSYFTKPSGLVIRNFTGTTSANLQSLIDANRKNGAIIKIPKKNYSWGEIKLKSKIQLEIEKGTVIKPINNSVRRIFSIGTSGNGARIKDVSIVGIGGKFTVDLSSTANLNKNMAVVKMGRVTNFKISNFNIKDRRSSLASILLNYIPSNSDNTPYPRDGIIDKINQTGAHTGYGLIQGYSANRVLFKNLKCTGGVTLRLETDDKSMKNAVKNGGKSFGMFNIYADKITGIAGICPIMLSPHFTKNGKVNARNITANGCAFAVRVEHGFIEVFDTNKTFALTTAGGQQFRNFIANKISGVPSGTPKFVGNQYKRANGQQWAIRLSDASVNGSFDSYIENQIGILKNGSFQNATFTNVVANYRANNAKLKQAFLKYFPCNQITNKIKRPNDTGMQNGFEFYGPSMGLVFDNTDGSSSDGNYVITVNGSLNGFGSNRIDILHNTPIVCNNPPVGQIDFVSTPGL
ncbi:hypothetical protein A8C32_10165 [Flavivirga aquatica]|uniref:Iota-carrageenase n=1 Tax=Flavivirga aquatica TaxID=1849968 RepID=A0A1E5TER9_9FLAO|nr:hypothetical protein [Flavivirga aquatica]OEK09865.1 hypothetical protein A8C32_10165 [Flavivirga aquatica]